MKQATLEQKQAAIERRAAMRRIAKQVADMTPEDRQAFAGRMPAIVTIEGHAMSLTNQCMLAIQFPGVAIVGGFRQWIKAGRCVRKGEHGLAIWIPLSRNTKEEDLDADSGKADIAFMLGTVFDVSQTAELQAKE